MCDNCNDYRVLWMLALRVACGDKELAEFADRTRAWMLGAGAEEHGFSQSEVDRSLREFNEAYETALRLDAEVMARHLEMTIFESND